MSGDQALFDLVLIVVVLVGLWLGVRAHRAELPPRLRHRHRDDGLAQLWRYRWVLVYLLALLFLFFALLASSGLPPF